MWWAKSEPLVEIGLPDLPKIGGHVPLRPPGSDGPETQDVIR